MTTLKHQVLALFLFGSASFAQTSTVIYGNSSDRLGTLSGWETRSSEVIFSDIGSFDAPIGGLAVSDLYGFSVSFESPSVYSRFFLSNPLAPTESSPLDENLLDSLVYDPFDGTVYSQSDKGNMYTFAPDGTPTFHGILSGLGADDSVVQWGSHGDLAIAPDSTNMYQIGFDLALQNESSINWHSLLLIDTNNLTSATRLGQLDISYGKVWGLAFDSTGSLFGVTSDSFMIEIDKTDGSILWHAPIVDSEGEAIAMWDLASNPHTIPEPSSVILVAFGLVGFSMALKRKARA